MSEIIPQNETEAITKPWYSDLWIVAIILSIPIRLVLEFWFPSPYSSAITYLVILNFFFLIMPKEIWLNKKIKSKFIGFLTLNLLFGIYLFVTFTLAKYFAQFIKIPPIVGFVIMVSSFFFLAGLIFYWITKSPKK